MAQKIFALSVPLDDARNRVASFFSQSGWQVSHDGRGGLKVERGNRNKSLWLGALAGKDMYICQYVDLATGPQGETLVTYSTTTGSGVMGGVIGVNKANGAFADTWPALANWLHPQGVLITVQ